MPGVGGNSITYQNTTTYPIAIGPEVFRRENVELPNSKTGPATMEPEGSTSPSTTTYWTEPRTTREPEEKVKAPPA